MKRFTRLTFTLLIVVMMAVLLFPAASVRAHGGFVLESGEIENYEWAVSIFPYPVTTGATVLSILLFDKTTGAPAMDFTGEVYLAEPGDTRQCCEPGVHRGPFMLTTDHTLYPGDYTTFIPVDVAGRWQILFKMKSSSGEYGIVSGFDAIPFGDGSQPVDKPAISTQVAIAFAAASTASAQRVAIANPLVTPQPVSPLAQSASPLAQPAFPLIESVTQSDSAAQPASTVAGNPAPPTSPATATTGLNRTFLLIGGLAIVVILGVLAMMLLGGRKENKE